MSESWSNPDLLDALPKHLYQEIPTLLLGDIAGSVLYLLSCMLTTATFRPEQLSDGDQGQEFSPQEHAKLLRNIQLVIEKVVEQSQHAVLDEAESHRVALAAM